MKSTPQGRVKMGNFEYNWIQEGSSKECTCHGHLGEEVGQHRPYRTPLLSYILETEPGGTI